MTEVRVNKTISPLNNFISSGYKKRRATVPSFAKPMVTAK